MLPLVIPEGGMVMDIGKLRHRVTLESYEVLKDNIGTEKRTWRQMTTVWASIEPVSGRELIAIGMEKAEVTTKVTIRYRSNIGPHVRIRFGDRIFEVVSTINPEERNILLSLMCKEILRTG